jgi:hypothetical protein
MDEKPLRIDEFPTLDRDPEPTAFESLSVDLPDCEWIRRLWIVWEDVPEDDRRKIFELAESFAKSGNEKSEL